MKELFEGILKTAIELNKNWPETAARFRYTCRRMRMDDWQGTYEQDEHSVQDSTGHVRLRFVNEPRYENKRYIRESKINFWPSSLLIDSHVIYLNSLPEEDAQLLADKLRIVMQPLFDGLSEANAQAEQKLADRKRAEQADMRELILSLG